jgi:hypothetical protein
MLERCLPKGDYREGSQGSLICTLVGRRVEVSNAHQADHACTATIVECTASKLLKRRLASQSMYASHSISRARNPTVYFLKELSMRELNYIYFRSRFQILFSTRSGLFLALH